MAFGLAVAVAAATLCHAAEAHAVAARTSAVAPYVNLGTTDAVYALIERTLPGSKTHFSLVLADTCPGSAPPCYSLADGDAGVVTVTATGAAELAAGVGYYLREYCSMSIGKRLAASECVRTDRSASSFTMDVGAMRERAQALLLFEANGGRWACVRVIINVVGNHVCTAG